MHDALARQPGERRRREHHKLAQLAKGDGHDQEGKATDRHGHGHALQHATRNYPPAHRRIVEGKGEGAEGSVKDTEQETFLPQGADAGPINGQLAAPRWESRRVAYRFRRELTAMAMALFLE